MYTGSIKYHTKHQRKTIRPMAHSMPRRLKPCKYKIVKVVWINATDVYSTPVNECMTITIAHGP